MLTWLVVAYALLSEKIPGLRALYHIVAVLALDGFLMIMWLATFASVAAKRAEFKINVSVDGCYNDGSDINSETCFYKRALEKRGLLFKSGQAMMSASAGLGALMWYVFFALLLTEMLMERLLFVATFVYVTISFARGRKEGRFKMMSGSGSVEPETAMQQLPLQQQQQYQETQQYQPQTQYQETQQYQPQQQQQYQQASYQASAHTGQAAQSMPVYPGHGSEMSSTPAQGNYYAPPVSPLQGQQ